MNNKFDIRFLIAVALVILSIASRFLPLAPNFSPIMAVALFSGVLFANRKLAMLIPITAMFISDLFLGLHSTMIAVYASFGIITLLGMRMKEVSVKAVLGNSVLSAVIFFIITNFAVWVTGWYGYTFAGLVVCYEMAIPFFRATLASSLLYSGLLFGGFYFAERFALEPAPTKVD
jgi:hypothetical protein